jgi:hypothetical protein
MSFAPSTAVSSTPFFITKGSKGVPRDERLANDAVLAEG